jgi:hypothetical protein
MYKLVNDPFTNALDCILRISDNAFFPLKPDNIDYQQYLAWLAEGNTPQPADE